MKIMQGIIFLALLFSFTFCDNKSGQSIKSTTDSDVLWNELKSSNDFWNFAQFILEHPESKHFYEALTNYDKTRSHYWDSIGDIPIIDCFDNCASVKLNSQKQIFFEHKLISINTLRDSLFLFFTNPKNNENLSENRDVIDIDGITRKLSKGRIEIVYILDSCEILQDVVIEISKSIKDYKEFLAEEWYCTSINEIDSAKSGFIDSLFRRRIIFFGWDKELEIQPPPPPPNIENMEFNIEE